LVPENDILLLDEPPASLDAKPRMSLTSGQARQPMLKRKRSPPARWSLTLGSASSAPWRKPL
jgi:hypothetical protein